MIVAASTFEISCEKKTDKHRWQPYSHASAVDVRKKEDFEINLR